MLDINTKITSDAKIPNILASSPKGNVSAFWTLKMTVVAPPTIIDHKAPVAVPFFQNKAPIMGTSKPDTMKA